MVSGAARRIGAQFEGLLLQQMLAPLAQSLGDAGQFALGPLAQSMAARDVGGFGKLVSVALERDDARR